MISGGESLKGPGDREGWRSVAVHADPGGTGRLRGVTKTGGKGLLKKEGALVICS